MSERPRAHLWARGAALVAAVVLCAAPALARPDREADDALTRYLDSRDLRALLIDHLEAMLARASQDERTPLAERLASLYADSLDRATDAETRAALERRATALLDSIPEGEGADLRLTLLRASYTRAEQTAERLRLLLAPPEASDEAIRSLRTLAAEFAQLGSAAHKRVEALERQEQAAADLDSSLLQEALANARRRRSLAMYLSGWAGVYLAELTSAPGAGERPSTQGLPAPGAIATEAAKRLGWVLNATPPGSPPTIERTTEGLLRLDHVARAAIGVGVCAAVRGDYPEAVRWFDLVGRAPDVTPGVREQLFARRLAAAARNDEWTDALRLLREKRGADTTTGTTVNPALPLAPTEARLLAALAFEANPPSRSAQVVKRLREIALADLIARDELDQALDLTRRFGAEALAGLGDARGFIVGYIRGLQAYERAREAHAKATTGDKATAASASGEKATLGDTSAAGSKTHASGEPRADDPVSDRATAALYEESHDLLKAALTAPDADRFGSARANAAMLQAMSAFCTAADAARAARAAERFSAAESLAQSPSGAADAAWMRVRSLTLAAEYAGAAAAKAQARAGSAESRALAEAEARRDAAVSEFLAKRPTDARAGALLLQRSATSKGDQKQTVEALLRIAPDAPTYAASRREAARLLYLAARDAPENGRRAAVERFAAVAEPMLREQADDARRGDADAGPRALLLARQLLDLYLSGAERAQQPARAEPALETLLDLEASGAVSLGDAAPEILYRRLQVAAATEDRTTLEALTTALDTKFAAQKGDRFVAAGRRLLLRRAIEDWRKGPASEALARTLVARGEAAIGAAAPTDDAGVAACAAVAEGAAHLFLSKGEAGAKPIALRFLALALQARPDSEAVLRQAAEFCAKAGEPALAAERWKRLLAGAEVGTPAWFEATCGMLEALRETQPALARELLDRHRALYPEMGPSPWGERLRAIDEALPRGAAPGPGAGGEAR